MIEQLICLEQKYGGLIQGVPRSASIHDTRSADELKRGTMQGGDRMKSPYHNYSPVYSKHLHLFLNQTCNIAEIGILTGIGLAIWCDIFPTSNVYGLDINLNNYTQNYDTLLSKGAFANNKPHVFTFDQYEDNKNYIGQITNNKKFKIVIDDGAHSKETILTTLESFIPHLEDEFVYFIEDNASIYDTLTKKYPQFNITSYGEMTVIEHHLKYE